MGRIASRQGTQTGKREILTRGFPQMRQSEGKKVANRLSASRSARGASEGCRGTDPSRIARVRSPVLLKTPSRRLKRSWAPVQANLAQYIGTRALTQCAGG